MPGPSADIAPWITAADIVKVRPKASELDDGVLSGSAAFASELLWAASGRQFAGKHPGTVIRPCAAPYGWSLSEWAGYFASLSGTAFSTAWGSCRWGDSHDHCYAPQLSLGYYPLVSVEQVLLDGVVIPPTEYAIADFRLLVRQAPSASYNPTARFGWPTCQDLRLPATEPGTFEVTFTWGQDPPQMGKDAAAAVAYEIAKSRTGTGSALPGMISSRTRQGVTETFVTLVQALQARRLGIWEADQFIAQTNPGGAVTRPVVWSPDMDTQHTITG